LTELGMVPLALLCLAASLAVGRMAYAGGSVARPVGTMALRGSAVALVVLAMASVGLAAMGLRGALVETQARVAAFSDAVARLDRSLRLAGDEGVAAREALFRYVDHMAREASPHSNPGVAAQPGGLSALRAALGDAVGRAAMAEGLPAGIGPVRALEGFLAAADALSADRVCRSVPWCEVALLSWMLVGWATLGVLVCTRRASKSTAIAVAVALVAAGMAWEGGAALFVGQLLLSGEMLETALYAIAD
jgi:hypothetical protein